ncbi:hypothetical protein AAEU32_11550 [Pseudoalteromonas sp. SSDWG2]|uniref:hypothetical protein n=1 Tax=Pseudoalteromonas sp. SSDWG2 TaxID=3139391 RepID=UPI003BA97C9A
MLLTYFAIALCGALSTFWLAKQRYFNAVRASSLLSMIAYGVFYLSTNEVELYSALFFGGTFVGMSAPHRFGWYTQCSAAGIFSLLFQFLVPRLEGYGGALGVSAFVAVCICHVAIVLGAPRSIDKP